MSPPKAVNTKLTFHPVPSVLKPAQFKDLEKWEGKIKHRREGLQSQYTSSRLPCTSQAVAQGQLYN